MLKLEHLTAAYPDGTKPVQDVSLCVEDGQRVALIGANGAGKTSLILSLVGVLPADGAVTVDGLTLCPENLPALRRKIGVVFQDPDDQLFMPTVLEDVAFGRTPLKLSGGEKRMAALATVLALEPTLLALDEPTAFLDPRARRTLINCLKGLDTAMLIATHDLPFAAQVQDPSRGQLGFVDEDLPNQAQTAADEKRFCVFHYPLPPSMATAWQTPGMGSPCWVEVGESSAPVPQNRMDFHFPAFSRFSR